MTDQHREDPRGGVYRYSGDFKDRMVELLGSSRELGTKYAAALQRLRDVQAGRDRADREPHDDPPGRFREYIEDRMVEAFASAYVGGRGDGALLRGVRTDQADHELIEFVRERAQEDRAVAQGVVVRIPTAEPGCRPEWAASFVGGVFENAVDGAGRDVTEEYLAWLKTLPREQADPWKAAACQAALDVVAAFEDNLANYQVAADRAPVLAVARIWRDHPDFRPEWA